MNRKSTTRFRMSLRRIVYVDPKPHKGAVKCSVQNLNIFKTVRDIIINEFHRDASLKKTSGPLKIGVSYY